MNILILEDYLPILFSISNHQWFINFDYKSAGAYEGITELVSDKGIC